MPALLNPPGLFITGTSTGYVALTADLSAFAGQTVTIGFRYWTDGAVVGNVVAGPIADKLASKLDAQEVNLSLMIDGLCQVAERRSPDAITDMLIVYLPEKARGAFVAAPA